MQITSAIAAASAGLSAASAATGTGTGTTPAPAATVTSGANQTVSTSQFMQLLSTEMANQDPMQPMDPTATMTQLAQFSSLQQTSQLSQYQSLAAANSFLGTQVTIPGTNGAPAVSGIVTGIDSSQVGAGSAPELILAGASSEYPLTSISQVTVPSSTTTGGSSASSSANGSTPAPSTQ